MEETQEHRLKRLYMRSIRRGIKEMDIVLAGFADRHLAVLGPEMLDQYENLLHENDHDLYAWISKTAPFPPEFKKILAEILTDLEKSSHRTDDL